MMTDLELAQALVNRQSKSGETVREIMIELGIEFNLHNARAVYTLSTSHGIATLLALAKLSQ